MFQLDASKKKVQGVIDEIILERFQWRYIAVRIDGTKTILWQ
jgi:hypothetical protein